MWWAIAVAQKTFGLIHTFELPFQQLLRCYNVYTDFAFCFFSVTLDHTHRRKWCKGSLFVLISPLSGVLLFVPWLNVSTGPPLGCQIEPWRMNHASPSTKSRNMNRQPAGCDGAENSTHCACCRVPEHITAVIELYLVQCWLHLFFFMWIVLSCDHNGFVRLHLLWNADKMSIKPPRH